MVNEEEGESRKSKFKELNKDSPKLAVALATYNMGFKVLPLISDSKKPAAKWGLWEGLVDKKQIRDYWAKYPGHGVGILTNHELCVLDADSEDARKALYQLEKKFGCYSNFKVETSKGIHFYYLVADGVLVKLSAHSTEKHPERLDVKASRSLVVGPHEKGKNLLRCDINHIDELTPITQEFVDAVVTHNGGNKAVAKSPAKLKLGSKVSKAAIVPIADRKPELAKKLLSHIDPDVGYSDWFIAAAAVHHEFAGSEAGLEVFDQWSQGGTKYKSSDEIESMWRSLKTGAAQ